MENCTELNNGLIIFILVFYYYFCYFFLFTGDAWRGSCKVSCKGQSWNRIQGCSLAILAHIYPLVNFYRESATNFSLIHDALLLYIGRFNFYFRFNRGGGESTVQGYPPPLFVFLLQAAKWPFARKHSTWTIMIIWDHWQGAKYWRIKWLNKIVFKHGINSWQFGVVVLFG